MTLRTGSSVYGSARDIPIRTLATHEEWRGHDSIIHRGYPLVLHDILQTAPIYVAFGEFPKGDFADIFTLPEYSGVTRHEITGPEIVLEPHR
jgi:hypothetical protein